MAGHLTACNVSCKRRFVVPSCRARRHECAGSAREPSVCSSCRRAPYKSSLSVVAILGAGQYLIQPIRRGGEKRRSAELIPIPEPVVRADVEHVLLVAEEQFRGGDA